MEHTIRKIETDISLLPSLLIFFEMFKLRLFYDKHNEEENVVKTIAIQCINFHKSTGLFLKYKTFKVMITKFVLNTVLNHMVLSWIIYSKNQMKYDME